MGRDGQTNGADTVTRPRRLVLAVAVVVVPVAVLALLRARPVLDARWQNHPAHFWLVLAAAAAATTLGWQVSSAARRRRDGRLLLVSLAFLSGAGFLGLHALATPGVLLGPNAGFEMATPVGLLLGSGFVALSARELSPATSARLLARARWILGALAAAMAMWAVLSLAEVPPLDRPLTERALGGWQLALGAGGLVGYGAGAVGYLRLYRRRRADFAFTTALAFVLLAEAMVTIAFAVNWRISWWEWHLLMLAAFAAIAIAARREWHQERFSALYLDQTLAGTGEVSVLFADLEGFTSFSESSPPHEVARMLNHYFSRLVPLLERHGGDVHELIGDAIMAVFNKSGGQPDHARLAAEAGLALQREAEQLAAEEPSWPRFRVGINSGEVHTGVIGAGEGYRKHGVVGDTVNLAARLEGEADAGEVVVGDGTYQRLPPGAQVERLPELHLKGKGEPVTAYVLRAVPRAEACSRVEGPVSPGLGRDRQQQRRVAEGLEVVELVGDQGPLACGHLQRGPAGLQANLAAQDLDRRCAGGAVLLEPSTLGQRQERLLQPRPGARGERASRSAGLQLSGLREHLVAQGDEAHWSLWWCGLPPCCVDVVVHVCVLPAGGVHTSMATPREMSTPLMDHLEKSCQRRGVSGRLGTSRTVGGVVEEVFAAETVIAAPRDRVWQALTDWSRAPDWMDGVDGLRSDGPLTAGTVLTFTTGRRDSDASIVAVEPEESLVIRSVLRGVVAEYAYSLEDVEGGTRVSLVATCATSGLRRLLAPMLHDAMRRTDSAQLESLRGVLEAD